MIKIENDVIKKIEDNRCFGYDTKIEDISKIVVTGNRIIEIYVKDDVHLVFVYYDDVNLECLIDYSFIKKHLEAFYDIEIFSKEHYYGFYILSEKREFIEPWEMLVEGFVELETPNFEGKYEDPIKIKDIVSVKRVTFRVIKITLKSHNMVYWLYADGDSADIKCEEIIAAMKKRH